jgi:hypothetical protein
MLDVGQMMPLAREKRRRGDGMVGMEGRDE